MFKSIRKFVRKFEFFLFTYRYGYSRHDIMHYRLIKKKTNLKAIKRMIISSEKNIFFFTWKWKIGDRCCKCAQLEVFEQNKTHMITTIKREKN